MYIQKEKALNEFKIRRQNFMKLNGYDILSVPELVDVAPPSISTIKHNLKQAIIRKIRNSIVEDVVCKYDFLSKYDSYIPRRIQSLRYSNYDNISC